MHRSINLETLETRRLFATFTVITTADGGVGSLREAINSANSTSAADLINFAIPGAGVKTIQPTSPLPAVFNPVTIDATTQPGYSKPVVAVDGQFIPAGTQVGFDAIAANVEIRGFSLYNLETAIRINGSSSRVYRNYLGLQPDGSTRGYLNAGVVITSGIGAAIGGSSLRNVIAFGESLAPGVGVNILGGLSTVVASNFIGTNDTGNAGSSSFGTGVSVSGNAGATVGPLNLGNTISGITGDGVALGPGGVDMASNRIGVQFSTTATLANTGNGITVTDGGHTINPGNIIAFNGGAGVRVTGAETNASIVGNSIYENGGLGIDIGPAGVTPNDNLDADTGTNNLQNFPVNFTARRLPSGKVRFRGQVQSEPSTAFFVDYYSSTNRDPSFFGEGQTSIGSESLVTDATGNATIDFISNGTYPVGLFFTTTAERGDNSGTSEFGRAFRSFLPGDLNGDGTVNNADIAPFVLALTNPAAYQAAFPDVAFGPFGAGDVNDDGAFNNADIAPFVALLTAPRGLPAESGSVRSGATKPLFSNRVIDRLGESSGKLSLASV